MASLLYWVSYHDILAQFSLRYWAHCRLGEETLPADLDMLVQQSSIHQILEVCLLSLPPDKPLLIIQNSGYKMAMSHNA